MTTVIKKRKLEYDDRVALQQADQAIRKDVIRALVELITNSNDSYHRMDDAGLDSSGVILIEIQRKHSNSLIRVRDYAEGMDGDMLDRKVGTYGAATSGFKQGRSVRGLWGRGLKDAIYGLGHGSVQSIHEGEFNRCRLTLKSGTPIYEQEKTIRATRVLRKQYDIGSGNGSSIEIIVSRPDIRVPQFDNLRRALARHFELRTIMSNARRRVVLRELDGRGKVEQEIPLEYKAPTGTCLLDRTFDVHGYGAQARLEVLRADVPLSTLAEEGPFADGGLLVISKHVVLDLTLLKYKHNQYASKLYGRVTCDHFHALLKEDEPVLTATRDGVNWEHAFAKTLKIAVETELEPLVEEERRRSQADEKSTLNKKLRDRVNNALKELNSIANSELGKLTGGTEDGGSGKVPYVPLSGFGFVPEYVYIQTGKPAGLTLRAAIPDKVAVGSLATLKSDNEEVRILTPQVAIEAREDFPNVGQARVEIEGGQVGTEVVITARLNGLEANAMVKVISKREPPQIADHQRHSSGLIKEVKFDATAEPKQRVRFDWTTASIIIATKAPSVAAYMDEGGKGAEDAAGQVLLAELIIEAMCREIARRGVENGNFLAMSGGEADAVQREYIRLQIQYAHRIHTFFVDSEFRRDGETPSLRRGRPSREQMLAGAVIEA